MSAAVRPAAAAEADASNDTSIHTPPASAPDNASGLPDASPRMSPQARPHICFVAPEAWGALSGDTSTAVIGGAEVQQSLLARLFVQSGYRVSMICLDYGQPRSVVVDGVTVIRAHHPDAGIPVLRFIHPRLTSLWKAMAEANADIYYQRSAGMLTAVVAEFARRHGKRSIFAGASDSDFQPGFQEIRYGRDRWLFERGLATVDAVVVQNATQEQDCLTHYHRQPVLIPSYYEVPKISISGPQLERRHDDYILWVAAMRPGKRAELVFELARRLPHRRFVMIGGPAGSDGKSIAYYEQLRAQALQLPNVEFLGFLPLTEVEPWFDQARLVLNTSASEGMPNVFLQAWARSIPTVAFIDVAAHLVDGPVYPVAADVDQAVAEIESLYIDEARWQRASARCHDYFVANHCTAGVLSRYAALFSNLMTEPEPHG